MWTWNRYCCQTLLLRLLTRYHAPQPPSDRISVTYDADAKTTTIEVRNLSLYLNTKRELYWTLSLLMLTILFVTYDIGSEDESSVTTLSIMCILSLCSLCALLNLVCLLVYYCVVVEGALRRCSIVVHREEARVQLSGFGFWNRFVCGCLFGRSVYLQRATLSNAFIQYRVRHARRRKCAWLRGDELWCYLRGYDASLAVGDGEQQMDVQEESTLCHQQFNNFNHFNHFNHVTLTWLSRRTSKKP